MAGVSASSPELPRIRATRQIGAIGYLRWRMYRNGLRRKGGKGELVARIIVYPLALLFVLFIFGVAAGAGYAAAHTHHLATLDIVFTGITAFQILISVNIAPPGMSFDPESLIRYPLRFSTFLLLRLMLGLFSASTVFGTAALLAAALGVSIAEPGLTPAVFAAALALALTNVLFIRMIFVWIDRWLSTRRAREILTGVFVLGSIAFQYANATFNNIGHRSSLAAQRAKFVAALHFYRGIRLYLSYLPSGRGAAAVLALHNRSFAAVALNLLLVLLYAGLFLSVFAWRIGREYRGENLSEGSAFPALASAHPRPAAAAAPPITNAVSTPAPPGKRPLLAPDFAACLAKEWIYTRRNVPQLYALVTPLAMVLIFAGRLGSLSNSGYGFPAGAAYALLSTGALAYNSFGLDGAGIQFYFLAPVRMRSVFLAKNLFAFTVNAVQLALIYTVLRFTAGAPAFFVLLSTVFWAMLLALLNATLGNLRSLSAPIRVDPSKLGRRHASGLSALLSFGLMLGAAALGAGLLAWSAFAHRPWLPVPILAAFAAGALCLYVTSLGRLDRVALQHREVLVEALVKA